MTYRLSHMWYLSAFAVALTLAVYVLCALQTAPTASVTVFDVETGDAALLRTEHGAYILIDTGPDASILRALGMILPPWQRSLRAVILTGDNKKETGGLRDVASRYRTPTPIAFGTSDLPYGASLSIDGVSVSALAPGVVHISHGTTLTISSSTPTGIYSLE